MRKSYKIDGLDCANCALQLEEKIKKAKIVENISINFMSEKMIIEDEDISKDKLVQIQKICDKFEDGVTIDL